MKKIVYITWLLAAVAACTKSEDLANSYINIGLSSGPLDNGASPDDAFTCIVTVKKSATDSLFFQLNRDQSLFPVDFQQTTGLSKRLLCKVRNLGTVQKGYGSRVKVLWYEPIDEGTVRERYNPSLAVDGLNILFDNMTSYADGFLTLHYYTFWGKNPVHHDFLLSYNPDDPTKIHIVHHANGDKKEVGAQGLIYFDLSSLPLTETDRYIYLYWTSLEGQTQQRQILIR